MRDVKVVILDRDGVINYDSVEYIKSTSEWHPIPSSIEAIAALSKAGFKVVVVTNQSGISRGFFTQEILHDIHEKMRAEVASYGGFIDGIFICPHGPKDNCDCRKPKSGLLLEVSSSFHVSPEHCILVGDSLRDIEAAKNFGCRYILVLTGNGIYTKETNPWIDQALIYKDLKSFVDDFIDTKKSFSFSSSSFIDANRQNTSGSAIKMVKEEMLLLRDLEHDLRVSCGGISQVAKLLFKKIEDAEQLRLLELLSKASDRLLDLLQGVRDYAGTTLGQLPIKFEAVYIQDLFGKIVDLVAPACAAKKLDLQVKYNECKDAFFFSDAFRLQRILLNLVNNAIKFTQDGTIKLIYCKRSCKDSKVVNIIVEDTGLGLSFGVKKFLVYKEGDDNRQNCESTFGIGLGLLVVRRFVADLGGDIEIEDVIPHGTRLSLTFPLLAE